MSGIISGNMVGGTAPLRTLIIEDTDGNQLTGVVVGSEVVFTANASTDIREGKVAATDAGVVTGSAIIPNYYTSEGVKIVSNGSTFAFSTPHYDYTKLQAVFCSFNTNLSDSVSADKVVLNDNVYDVKSTTSLSVVTKQQDDVNGAINFGITNTSGSMCVIRYFMYKELY